MRAFRKLCIAVLAIFLILAAVLNIVLIRQEKAADGMYRVEAKRLADEIAETGSYDLAPLGSGSSPRTERTIESRTEVLQDYCKNTDQYGAIACAKLWKRTLAQSEQFNRQMHLGEDTQYVQRALHHAKRIKLMC